MEWETVEIPKKVKKYNEDMLEIKEIRKNKGWTQKVFAEYLGIPLITYVQWENGTRKAPQYVLELIKYKCRTDTKQIKLDLIDQKHFKNTCLDLLNEINTNNYKDSIKLCTIKEYIKELL